MLIYKVRKKSFKFYDAYLSIQGGFEMERKTTAVCLLTRNNETTIGLAIKSVLALVDEVLVVDIGSSDNTRIIAEGYGARVIDHVFDGDYAKAKNVALDEVSSNWVLWLNPNENVMPIRPHDFQELLRKDYAGYRVEVVPESSNLPISMTETLRLFRYHPDVRYQYPVRERIKYSLCKWNARIEDTDVMKIWQNDGNMVDHPRGSQKVISLLAKNIKDNPHDPYPEYALAREHIQECEGEIVLTPTLNSTIHTLRRAVQKFYALSPEGRQHLCYLPDLMIKLSACRLATDNIDLAWQLIQAAKKLYPQNLAVILQYVAVGTCRLCSFGENTESEEVKNFMYELLATIELLREHDVELARITRYEGEIALFMRDIKTAQGCFELALSIDENYSYALLGLAQCQMLSGDKAGAVKFYIAATQKNKYNYLAWLQGSKTLRDLGFVDNANIWQSAIPEDLLSSLELEAIS